VKKVGTRLGSDDAEVISGGAGRSSSICAATCFRREDVGEWPSVSSKLRDLARIRSPRRRRSAIPLPRRRAERDFRAPDRRMRTVDCAARRRVSTAARSSRRMAAGPWVRGGELP
jgi:hypothetical protein